MNRITVTVTEFPLGFTVTIHSASLTRLGQEEAQWLALPGSLSQACPNHVTQRGNRRGTTFFEEDDFAAYRELLADAARITVTVTEIDLS